MSRAHGCAGATQLKTPYGDGTTHVIFEPLDFITPLACGGAVRIVACIEDPVVIAKIFTHLGKNAAAADLGRVMPSI